MKKFLKLTFILGLIFSLVGCAEKDVNNEVVEENNIVEEKKIEVVDANIITMTNKSGDKYEAVITDTDGGTLYSIVHDDFKAKMIIGDNYFDTQISDLYKNFNTYEGNTIEIEGFVLNNGNYTFVSRYSENNLCTDCPTGYSYFEYEWHGDEVLKFEDETTWIKVKGELKKGNDGVEYYYIDAYSIEVMDEWGKVPTVVN